MAINFYDDVATNELRGKIRTKADSDRYGSSGIVKDANTKFFNNNNTGADAKLLIVLEILRSYFSSINGEEEANKAHACISKILAALPDNESFYNVRHKSNDTTRRQNTIEGSDSIATTVAGDVFTVEIINNNLSFDSGDNTVDITIAKDYSHDATTRQELLDLLNGSSGLGAIKTSEKTGNKRLLVAEFFDTDHLRIKTTPDGSGSIIKITNKTQDPLSDLKITVGTYLPFDFTDNDKTATLINDALHTFVGDPEREKYTTLPLKKFIPENRLIGD